MAERMVAIEWGFVGDKNDVAAIREVERQTHDLLLTRLDAPGGASQRAGVVWTHYNAGAGLEIVERLREAGLVDDPQMLRYLRDTPDSLLIVATCEHSDE